MSLPERYGRLDRLLHRIAFRAGTAQHALADVEEMLYRERLRSIPLERPVFISGLPRAGTTTLLGLLWETDRFASQTYRDMPFVLCPLLWSRFSRRFVVDTTPRERDHGDGIRISGESPEAFEEVIWKRFWPSHYGPDRIETWTASDRDPEFDAFFEAHMRKVIALRRGGPNDERRYLSKNNVNIARLPAPPAPLGRGVMLVPFREPIQHAASCLRQHLRFSELHEQDAFMREYMEAVGHHDFGLGLRPIDFGGWVDGASDPRGLEFWLRYWIAAYGFVLEHAGASTVLVSYTSLTSKPEPTLARIADAIGIPAADLAAGAGGIHRPRSHEVAADAFAGAAVQEARELHQRLERAAL